MNYVEVTGENVFEVVNNDSPVGVKWASENKTTIVETISGFRGVGKKQCLKLAWERSNKALYCAEVLGRNTNNQVLIFKTNRELFEWLSIE